jgi:hypothetical protein
LAIGFGATINKLWRHIKYINNMKQFSGIKILIITMITLTACSSSTKIFKQKKTEEFAMQPLQSENIISEKEIAHLPGCVKKYLAYSGAIGKSKPQNVYIEFEADMYRKPGDKPMKATSEQYNFYGNYSRLFLMKASKMFIPFRAMHIYRNQQATFRVRVANLFNVVDLKGEELTIAETVTLLNDMCIFAPGSLIDNRLSWKEIDSLSTEVFFVNGNYKVSAKLYFNEKGELINFISDDRSALQDNGTMKRARWSTPVKEYKEIDGRKIPTFGETIWHYPEGDFWYGAFRLKKIIYNVKK